MADWNPYENQQPETNSEPQPTAQQTGGTYHYGKYAPQQVPQSTQNGGYSVQPQEPQQAYSQPYTQPYAQPAPAPDADQPKKKKSRVGATVLTASVSVVMTAVLIFGLLWGFGVIGRTDMPVGSREESTPSQSGKPNDVAELSPEEQPQGDAFDLHSHPAYDESLETADGQLTPKQVAEKVVPTVVCIETRASANTLTTTGSGSGIIFTEDGYIVTNAHVVEGAAAIQVILYDGSIYEAQLIGSDIATDLAVIKIEASGLQAAEFGSSDDLAQGEWVMAIGNPGGLAFSSSVTMGIVSATNRLVTVENGYSMSCIQTDAAINPGNSGGALVNMFGQVVGINSSKIVATGYEGLGFAISVNEAQSVVTDLKNHGYVTGRAFLGIQYQFVTEAISMAYRLPIGVYIGGFTTTTMSDAGCQLGDILTIADGQALTSSTMLPEILRTKDPGDTMTFTVYRSQTNETFEITVTLGENKPYEQPEPMQPVNP